MEYGDATDLLVSAAKSGPLELYSYVRGYYPLTRSTPHWAIEENTQCGFRVFVCFHRSWDPLADWWEIVCTADNSRLLIYQQIPKGLIIGMFLRCCADDNRLNDGGNWMS